MYQLNGIQAWSEGIVSGEVTCNATAVVGATVSLIVYESFKDMVVKFIGNF